MFKKLAFALMTFSAVVADQVIVSIKPNPEQLDLINKGYDDSEIRGQLMQPLNQERLQDLEKAAGMTLFDIGPIGTGGRVVRTEHQLSTTEMTNLLEKLNRVPWVEHAEENVAGKIHRFSKKSKFLRPSGQ